MRRREVNPQFVWDTSFKFCHEINHSTRLVLLIEPPSSDAVILSHTKYQLKRLKKSAPPQHRHLKTDKQIVKHKVDDFMGELTF